MCLDLSYHQANSVTETEMDSRAAIAAIAAKDEKMEGGAEELFFVARRPG
jgi:hypothetical protein